MCHLEGDSTHSMTTNDERLHEKYDKFRLIENLWQIWHDRAKNIHQQGAFGSYRKPFELGKELEHEEEGKCHESY